MYSINVCVYIISAIYAIVVISHWAMQSPCVLNVSFRCLC